MRWDAHVDVKKNHGDRAAETDAPVVGLLTDLKQRGLLDSTLVIWGGEFSRLPISQSDSGRDHNRYGFTIWMAGGGIKGGGATAAPTNSAGRRPMILSRSMTSTRPSSNNSASTTRS